MSLHRWGIAGLLAWIVLAFGTWTRENFLLLLVLLAAIGGGAAWALARRDADERCAQAGNAEGDMSLNLLATETASTSSRRVAM